MKAEDLEILMSEYNDTFDGLVEIGVVQAQGDTVLLRGITKEEIQRGSKGLIETDMAASATDIRQSVVFEVVSVGSEVPEEIQPGLHCVPISAGMDPIRAGGSTKYAVVDYEDIQLTWNPGEAVEGLRDYSNSAIARRKRANGLED